MSSLIYQPYMEYFGPQVLIHVVCFQHSYSEICKWNIAHDIDHKIIPPLITNALLSTFYVEKTYNKQ